MNAVKRPCDTAMKLAWAEMERAERAWEAELVRLFGEEEAGQARYYDRGKGTPGSLLSTLHAARATALGRWTELRERWMTAGSATLAAI